MAIKQNIEEIILAVRVEYIAVREANITLVVAGKSMANIVVFVMASKISWLAVFAMGCNGSIVAASKSFVIQKVIIFEWEASFNFRISLIGMVKPIPKLMGSLVFILVFPFRNV